MCRKGSISVFFLAVMCVVIILCTASAALADSSSSKVLRFTVVKRTAHFVIIKHHGHRYAVRRWQSVVNLKGVARHSYRVVRRTRHYIFLRAVPRTTKGLTTRPTIISPTGGSFAQGTSTTISWQMPVPVAGGCFSVSLKGADKGASTQLNTDTLSALPDVTSYSMPWNITQAAGTYRLRVSYCTRDKTVNTSAVSDDTIVITPGSDPTPAPTPTVTPTVTPTPTPTPTVTPTSGPTHPGLILTQADIDAIRARLNAGLQPQTDAWNVFLSTRVQPALNGTPAVFAGPVTEGGVSSPLELALDNDGAAARNLGLAYVFTSDLKYAQKARDYLVAWAEGNTPTTYADCADGWVVEADTPLPLVLEPRQFWAVVAETPVPPSLEP